MLTTSTPQTEKAGLFAAVSVLLGICVMFWSADQGNAFEAVSPLLETSETILGQPFSYPVGKAKVTAAILTMQPGATTGWHKHPVPVFGYVLDGEITVDYGPHGKRVYRKGDSLMEAINTAHDGRNTGEGIAHVLGVFLGAEEVANTTKVAPPK